MGNQKKASVQEVIQHTAVGKTYKVDAPLHSMTDSMTVLVPAVIDADSNEDEDVADGWMDGPGRPYLPQQNHSRCYD